MNKLYSVHDHWTDINKKNDVDIESIDGVITGIKVNGEDYGGSTWNKVFTGNVVTSGEASPFIGTINVVLNDADTIKVFYNSTEYILPKQVGDYGIVYGATPGATPEDIDFSEYPFLIRLGEVSTVLYTQAPGPQNITIFEPASGGGESDFSTAEVTVVNNYENAFAIHASFTMDNDEAHTSVPDTDSSNIGDRTKLKIILYKGNAVMSISGFPLSAAPTITTSGNIQIIEIDHIYIISGDCTITIS